MEALILSLLASSAVAAPAPLSSQPLAIPITYAYGGYPRIETNITWGTPAQPQIPTIFDTGSSSFWVYGPNATINDGSQYHFTPGPCNKTVTNFYNWPESTSHSEPQPRNLGFNYGGNGKMVSASAVINDTFSFADTDWPALVNNEVALADYTLVSQGDENCAIPESSFDHSILGLAPISKDITDGPSFRQNLLDQERTSSSSFSMWFDKAPTSSKGTYRGVSVFGAVPSQDKYSGELVRVKLSPPDEAYVGYYVATPQLSAKSSGESGDSKTIEQSDKSVKQCLLDSGTGEDRVPFSKEQLINATGIIEYNNSFLAWNGSCESIPANATLDWKFAGSTAGKYVTVSTPIRSYARGERDVVPGFDSSKFCGLSLSADEVASCVFGAPFFTSLFAVFSDENQEVAMAQGGVSTGASDGPSGLGALTTIVAGENIPGAV